MKIILASQSLRRKELMDQFKIPYEIMVSDIDETLKKELSIEEQPQYLAYQKAKTVWERTIHVGDRIIIGCDTIVVKNGKLYGKPQSRDEAIANFREFSGSKQKVITGYSILIQNQGKKEEECGSDKAYITFHEMTEEDIAICLEKENVFDKAGGYNIVSFSGVYLKRIEGNIPTVMGLPMDKIYQILKKYQVLSDQNN